MTDQRLVSDIKSSEGCRLTAYKDTNGFWTIGYGHKLEAGIDWEGQEWTQDVADHQLAADIDEADEQALNLPEVAGLNLCRTNAVVELVFNMGLSKWHGFEKCRHALGTGDYTTAAAELLNSDWAREVQPSRVQRLHSYILYGTY